MESRKTSQEFQSRKLCTRQKDSNRSTLQVLSPNPQEPRHDRKAVVDMVCVLIEDLGLRASLGYAVRVCLKEKKP